MRNRLLALAGALFLAGLLCLGQTRHVDAYWQSRDSNYNQNVASGGGGGYTGPGDIVSGASMWFGVRAYNAAYATANSKLINVERQSDSSTCDILAATGGGTGVTGNCSTSGNNGLTAQAYMVAAAADATCTGSAAGSATLTLTSCTGTPVQYDIAIATGGTGSLTQPSFVTIVTCCTGGAGTTAMSSVSTIAAASVSFYKPLMVEEAYDQTGNGNNATPGAGFAPYLLLGCAGGTSPCLLGLTGNSQLLRNTSISAISQPFSMSTVAKTTASAGTEQYALALYNGTGSGILSFDEGGTANNNRLYCGSDTNITATDGQIHQMNGVCHGASTVFNIDGTSQPNASGGTTTSGTSLGILAQGASNLNNTNGYSFEDGIWPVDFTSSISTLCHNQYLFYGTPNSC